MIHMVVGPLEIDHYRHEIRINGKPAPFTAAEFRLLSFLASAPGRCFTYAECAEAIETVSAPLKNGVAGVLRPLVYRLRRKLGAAKSLLVTVKAVGYRLESP